MGFKKQHGRVTVYNLSNDIPSAMGSARLNVKIIIGAILPNANDAARFSALRKEKITRDGGE